MRLRKIADEAERDVLCTGEKIGLRNLLGDERENACQLELPDASFAVMLAA